MGKWLQVLKTLWTSSQAIKGVAVVAAVAVVGTTTYVAAPYVFTGNNNETVVESEDIQDTMVIDDDKTPGANMKEDTPQNIEVTREPVASDSENKKESPDKKTDSQVRNEELSNVIIAEKVIVEETMKTDAVEKEIAVEEEEKSSSDNKSENKKPQEDKPTVESEYKLVWEDNFDAEKLNRDDWNVELHQPGWVNAEWQEYVDSEENIYLEDGKLVLQAIKTTKDGKDYYTSGRVNTRDKHDFKYGKFEAKLKVPSGMGFLPAFWMMPTDEGFYGQWPKCGEIDIMEVMGQSTNTLHGTIHYGEPHGQKQGTYVLDASKKDFAETFHVYTCEWEPGKITWYVDGIKFHEANDWYTKRPGFDEAAYPAPFDQPFYMIFNVAVGGSWVGYPDETTEFGDNAQMVVDYVRVYQKDSYDENVTKPEKAEVPDSEIGVNLLNNGEFTNSESFTDGNDWEFLLANGGEGTASVVDITGNKALKITTSNAGTVDYSVQLVQGPIALKQGNKYRVTFDAWADEARNMKALISAPDLNYIRYWGDQTVNLTQTKQTFTYEFDMPKEGDANSRFEMTFGNMGSTATVYIDNVKVEKVGTFEIAEEAKTVLPDGNFVYNSGFDTGSDRMKYWVVDSNIAGVNYLATNVNGTREFKVVVPNTVSDLTDVVLKQENTAITGGKNYLFTFDAYGAEAKTIKAVIAPDTAAEMAFDVDVTTSKKEYSFNLTMPEGVTGADVKFLIGAPGTTYIDNVRVQEDANVINGNFTSGTAGWELYAYTPGDVTFAIDELDNGSGTPAAAINISKTGDTDWHIQLKQAVTLEQGKRYRISFDTWSTVERKFLFAIQRNPDKKGGGDWTSYSGDITETMSTTGFEHYSKEFDMTWETDDIAELKFTLGAVGGVEINTPHTVFIDNVVLEEIGTCSEPEIPKVEAGVNMFTNASFESGELEPWIVHAYGEGSATYEVKDNAITVDVKSVGTADGMVSLQYKGLTLETGASYVLTFDSVSTESRAIKPCFMDPDNGYAWYGGTEVALEKDIVKSVEFPFTVDAASSNSVMLQVGMGLVGDSTIPSQIIMSNFMLIKVEGQTPSIPNVPEVEDGTELLTNGDFADGTNGWSVNTNSPAVATTDVSTGKLVYDISNVGTTNWHMQLLQNGLQIEAGASYKVSFTIKSSIDRQAKWVVMEDGNTTGSWSLYYNGGVLDLSADVETPVTADFTASEGCNAAMFQFTFAPDSDMALTELVNNPVNHTIEIDNVSLVKVSDAPSEVAIMTLDLMDEVAEPVVEETTEEESVEESSEESESLEEV